MELARFLHELEKLTGRAVRELTPSEEEALGNAIKDDEEIIDYSQFNELLLIANKDRVEASFFKYFFVSPDEASECPAEDEALCILKDIPKGIERFQKFAMLRFGNFIYAYRLLSKLENDAELEQQLGEHCRKAEDLKAKFKNRRPKILEIKTIERERTYQVGYLSATQASDDSGVATLLLSALNKQRYDNLEALQNGIEATRTEVEKPKLIDESIGWINRFQKKYNSEARIENLRQTVTQDQPKIEDNVKAVRATQVVATKNTDTYLTWDHLDVYFATSMRKRWEYEDLFDLVNDLMEEIHNIMVSEGIENPTERKLRYFDPTQSFDVNRINKGLIEGLMLKRAACTVYSVQDTDTLGKDSELAATLAQGKPVIAYAPKIDVEARAAKLMKQKDPLTLRERLHFVSNGDDKIVFAQIDPIRRKLNDFADRVLWKSLVDQVDVERFQTENNVQLNQLCHVIAESESRIYDSRANTLLNTHPLGIQVNLDTGVANGVLVARDIPTCAKLLWRVLINNMKFVVKEDNELKAWLLLETLTKSTFRVVTKNPKLTNCFWNFYRESTVLANLERR